jgi:hypothetical protein
MQKKRVSICKLTKLVEEQESILVPKKTYIIKTKQKNNDKEKQSY